jgi:hypothetical protein
MSLATREIIGEYNAKQVRCDFALTPECDQFDLVNALRDYSGRRIDDASEGIGIAESRGARWLVADHCDPEVLSHFPPITLVWIKP